MTEDAWQIAPGSFGPNLKLLKVVIKLLKTLNVGIDISLKEATISLLTWEGKYLGKSFKISNNPSGAKELEDRVLSILSLGNFEHIRFGMEATRKLADFIWQNILLLRINFQPGSHWSI